MGENGDRVPGTFERAEGCLREACFRAGRNLDQPRMPFVEVERARALLRFGPADDAMPVLERLWTPQGSCVRGSAARWLWHATRAQGERDLAARVWSTLEGEAEGDGEHISINTFWSLLQLDRAVIEEDATRADAR